MTELDHDEQACPPLKARGLGHLHFSDGTIADIEHVFAGEGSITCGDCGEAVQDAGFVGLTIADDEGVVQAMLAPEDALLLAARLTRAANLVLETGEQPPDFDREAAKYGRHDHEPSPELPG